MGRCRGACGIGVRHSPDHRESIKVDRHVACTQMERRAMTRWGYLLIVVSTLWLSPTFAQSAVAETNNHQNFFSSPAALRNPVVPARPGEVTTSIQPTPKRPSRR